MNHYDTLEVSPKASPPVVKAAYRSLMQRYHPDKNPGDSAAAAQALLVRQAFEVLGDETQRAAYDAQLKAQEAGLVTGARQAAIANARATLLRAARRNESARNDKFHWVGWLLIIVATVACLWLITQWMKRKSPEVELSEKPLAKNDAKLSRDQTAANTARRDETLVKPPDQPTHDGMKEDAARTLPSFLTDLRVSLGPGEAEDGAPILTIPTLTVKVGNFDAQNMKRYLTENKATIRKKVEAKLATAKPEELAKTTGDLYLQELILAAIGEATGTNRAEKNYLLFRKTLTAMA